MGDTDSQDPEDMSTRVNVLSAPLADPGRRDPRSDRSFQDAVVNQVRRRLFSGPNPASEIGRYQVLEVIGEGGMGTVLRAFDPQLHREVALKVLQEQLTEQDEMRLRREAVAMARLSHPNVVQVYEVGEADGRIFVAMELVSGQTLHPLVQAEHDWRQCVDLFIRLGRGLAAAHECGLVHRDFKPGNALIDAKGRPRVLDFGLARQADSHETDRPSATARPAMIPADAIVANTPLTRTGMVMGTPAYMSPEQYRGAVVDARSDQFSFCATLYEALHGERPFVGGQLQEIMERIERGAIAPTPAGTRVPRALRKILVRGMASNPDDRWASMDALLAELEALVAPKSSRWLAGSLVAGLLAVAGGLVASRSGGSASPPPQTDEAARGEAEQDEPETRGDESGRGPVDDVPSGSSGSAPASLFEDVCPDDPALVLCFRFDSVEGKTVYDDVDRSMRGTLSGDATIGEGRFGPGLVLPGKDGRITMDTQYDPAGSFSIDMWRWMDEGAVAWAGVVDKWVHDRGYWLGGTERSGGLALWVDNISISAEAAPQKRWTHVAGTFDIVSGVMSLYVDGNMVALGRHIGPVTPTDHHPLLLGWSVLDKGPFRGKLDSIRIWNRVLGPQELKDARRWTP